MIFTRKTVKEAIEFTGRGLHSGVPVHMRIHPGNVGLGFRYGAERVLAHPKNVTDTARSTKLGAVGTVEHLMSAFCGLGITDAEVELDAPEVPGVDGSARPFVEAILQSGIEEIGTKELPALYRRVFLQDGDVKVAVGKGNGHWRFEYITGQRWPGVQGFEVLNVADQYVTDVAGARTFALEEELPMIKQYGLGQGLDEHSAVLVGPEGYLNEVRFVDELARHKLLDLLGDLYLSGVPAQFLSVVAERSGHRTNVKVAQMLVDALGAA